MEVELPESEKGVRITVIIDKWLKAKSIHVGVKRTKKQPRMNSLMAIFPAKNAANTYKSLLMGEESLDGLQLADGISRLTKEPVLLSYNVPEDAHWPDEKIKFQKQVLDILRESVQQENSFTEPRISDQVL